MVYYNHHGGHEHLFLIHKSRGGAAESYQTLFFAKRLILLVFLALDI